MRTENINKYHPDVTTTANVANVFSEIVALTIPAGKVYRVKNATPLLLKLVTSGGTEISPASLVYLGWKDPISETVIQCGRIMDYGIFARLTASQQEDVNTQARRLITFDSEEIARAEAGKISIITGLPQNYKIVLMLKSAQVVDWTQTGSIFNFDAEVMSEEEFLAFKKGGKA